MTTRKIINKIHPRFWKLDEEKYLIDNYSELGPEKCASFLKKKRKSVISKARKLNLSFRTTVVLSLEDIEWLKENYKTYGAKFCSKKLNIPYRNFARYVKKFKILLTSKEKSNLYSDFRADKFLNIQTPEVSYILGLLWADGFIDKPNAISKNRIQCALVEEDFLDIENIFLLTGKWNIHKRFPKNRKPIKEAIIGNVELWNFLVENDYHIKSITSADKVLSLIPQELKHYFWRGYFDGDGWFNFQKGIKYCFGLSSNLNQDWNFVIDLFKTLEIKYHISKRETSHGNSSQICAHNFDGVKKFANYIYQNYDNIGLKRKYFKYIEMLDVKTESQKRYLCFR